MTQLPIPSVIALYDINLFRADSAARLLALTGKAPRVSADRAAILLNSAIRKSLGRIGKTLASPPSEQARWAAQLADAAGQALALLSPLATTRRAPRKADLIDAYSRLFDCGMPVGTEPTLKRYGFNSPAAAIELGTVGLWFLNAFAVHAASEWRKNLLGVTERKVPNPALFVWLQTMGALYTDLVEAEPPREPSAGSPFIRFCDGVRRTVIQSAPQTSEEISMRAFLSMLRGADPEPVAAFVRRYKQRLWSVERPTKQAIAAV